MKYITEITLHNYRGYKHTVIPITSGLNVIYGEGGHGKSALVKAIRWCLLDERQKRFARKDILTKSGNIKTSEEAYVQTNFNTGEAIRRGADSTTSNLYWVGHVDKPFEEWGDPIKNFKDVPEEVLEIINLSSVNVGKQFDLHFLLSQKGSEIAKDLNKMVNLEIIDSSQSNVKHFVTKVKREKESAEFNLVKYEKDLEAYTYLDEMGVALDKVEKIESSIAETKEATKEIGLLLNTLDEVSENMERLKRVVSFKTSVEALQELDVEVGLLTHKREEVASMLTYLKENGVLRAKYNGVLSFKDKVQSIQDKETTIDEIKEEIKSITLLVEQADVDTSKEKSVVAFKESVNKIMELEEKIAILNTSYVTIENVLNTVEENGKKVVSFKKEISEMKENLVGLCPTCGQSLEKCKEVV